jgi:hypothetical protein
LVVLLGSRLRSITDGRFLSNAGLEHTAEVRNSEKEDHQQGQDEAELDEGLTARCGSRPSPSRADE